MLKKIATLLANTAATFARVEYTTKVKTAAAYKNVDVRKHTVANIQLFANVNAATEVFANAVKKSASKLGQNADHFQSQGNYFHHTKLYSIVKHNIQDKFYLWGLFHNGAKSVYSIDGVPVKKEAIVPLLTPAEREKFLNSSKRTHNKTYDIEHEVVVRTIALENITSITTMNTKVTP